LWAFAGFMASGCRIQARFRRGRFLALRLVGWSPLLRAQTFLLALTR
jgi:hypothetical protein